MLPRMSPHPGPHPGSPPPPAPVPAGPALGLGLDAGGTATRWALAAADGQVLASGQVGGLSGLMLADAAGRAALQAQLAALAQQVAASAAAWPAPGAALARVVAGFTGFADADAAELRALLAAPLALRPQAVQLMSDIELACRSAFAPGAGIVVIAGTGSIAAHLDAQGQLLRAGGRGLLIDDAGGGVWIATRALRALWRLEDAQPGAATHTALGRQLLAQLGGSDWAATRAWLYGSAGRPGAARGEIGRLALAVAAAADAGDATALALLQQAGRELAALALRLQQRCGPAGQPLARAGRAWLLHPALGDSFAAALPPGTVLQPAGPPAEQAAARLAATQSAP